MRVGEQIAEIIGAHRSLKRRARKQEIESILQEVQLGDTGRIYSAYPNQLSGGELHRELRTSQPDLWTR
jgi:peptide/nickel transport system ATP-binding protein